MTCFYKKLVQAKKVLTSSKSHSPSWFYQAYQELYDPVLICKMIVVSRSKVRTHTLPFSGEWSGLRQSLGDEEEMVLGSKKTYFLKIHIDFTGFKSC